MRPIGSTRGVAELESRITDLSRENARLSAQLAQRTAALQEMMAVYAGIGHGATWEIAPENRAMLVAAAEQARVALAVPSAEPAP